MDDSKKLKGNISNIMLGLFEGKLSRKQHAVVKKFASCLEGTLDESYNESPTVCDARQRFGSGPGSG